MSKEIYLVIDPSTQHIVEAENISEIYMKYPEIVIAVIKLDRDTIEEIKKLE